MTCPTHRLGPFSSSLPSIPALHHCYHAGCAGAGHHQSSVQLGCSPCICCAGCRHCLLQGIVIDGDGDMVGSFNILWPFVLYPASII